MKRRGWIVPLIMVAAGIVLLMAAGLNTFLVGGSGFRPAHTVEVDSGEADLDKGANYRVFTYADGPDAVAVFAPGGTEVPLVEAKVMEVQQGAVFSASERKFRAEYNGRYVLDCAGECYLAEQTRTEEVRYALAGGAGWILVGLAGTYLLLRGLFLLKRVSWMEYRKAS